MISKKHSITIEGMLCFFLFLFLGVTIFSKIDSPLTGDQAFFLQGARSIDASKPLYTHFWDLKQPGIFVFYYLGAKMFGFNETGIRIFELCYWLSIGILLGLIQKTYRVFSSSLQLTFFYQLFLIAYYSTATSWHFTQLEILIAGPFVLYCSLWRAIWQRKNTTSYYLEICIGLCATVILYFKILLFPLLFSPPIVFWFYSKRTHDLLAWEHTKKSIIHLFGILLIGFFIIIAFHYFQGNAFDLLYTSFITPFNVVGTGNTKSFVALLPGIKYIFKGFIGTIPIFLLYGYYYISRQVILKPMDWIMVLSILCSLLIIAIQRTSYWEYHFNLLFLPLAWLTISFLSQLNQFRRGYLVAVLSTFLIICSTWNLISTYTHDTDHYVHEKKIIADFNLTSAQDDLFIGGSPILYYLLSSDQPIAMNGWAMEFYSPQLWTRFTNEIENTAPMYIFLDSNYRNMISHAAPAFTSLLGSNYFIYKETADGTLWRLLDTRK